MRSRLVVTCSELRAETARHHLRHLRREKYQHQHRDGQEHDGDGQKQAQQAPQFAAVFARCRLAERRHQRRTDQPRPASKSNNMLGT